MGPGEKEEWQFLLLSPWDGDGLPALLPACSVSLGTMPAMPLRKKKGKKPGRGGGMWMISGVGGKAKGKGRKERMEKKRRRKEENATTICSLFYLPAILGRKEKEGKWKGWKEKNIEMGTL